MLVRMPDALDKWEEYNQLRLAGIAGDDHGAGAKAYYVAHQLEMASGAKVGWEHDVSRGKVDALQTAMDLYLQNRRAFASEHQQDPQDELSRLYLLTPDMVAGKVNGLARGAVPEAYQYVTAGIDVNAYALTWAVCAIRYDLNVSILDYGVYPGAPAELWTPTAAYTVQDAVWRAILEVGKILAGRFPTMHRIAVDGNYETDTVHGACAKLDELVKPDVVTARGVSSKSYWQPIGKKGLVKAADGVHILRQAKRGKALWFDSHRAHKLLQCGLLLPPTAAGAVSLFGQAGQEHLTIAQHICADVLVSVQTRDDGREVMTWERPDESQRNDLSDAAAMAIMAAAVEGAKPNAEAHPPKRKSSTIHRIGGTGPRAGPRTGSAGWRGR